MNGRKNIWLDLVEGEIEFERVTAEEDQDDGDEDDGQAGLSLLPDRAVQGSNTSYHCSRKEVTHRMVFSLTAR